MKKEKTAEMFSFLLQEELSRGPLRIPSLVFLLELSPNIRFSTFISAADMSFSIVKKTIETEKVHHYGKSSPLVMYREFTGRDISL